MKISNTQLAAALVVLGYEILPSTSYSHKEVVFDFKDDPQIEEYKNRWRSMGNGSLTSPLSMMYAASKARQWVLDQVIHGDHNAGLELPAVTMETTNLDFAVCLVAGGNYLLKLDKDRRVFHFDSRLESQRELFNNPTAQSNYHYLRAYLRSLSVLVKQINNRNLTRQQNQHAITCVQP
jgi:hypothetical protein